MMQEVARQLRYAYARIALQRIPEGKAHLEGALLMARQLPCDVPRNRCLRAYIAQALEALQ